MVMDKDGIEHRTDDASSRNKNEQRTPLPPGAMPARRFELKHIQVWIGGHDVSTRVRDDRSREVGARKTISSLFFAGFDARQFNRASHAAACPVPTGRRRRSYAMATTTRDGILDRAETETLIASDKVEGTPVYGADGKRIGKIERLMIDKYTGKVAYAVMTFGGFLGIGADYYPIPWELRRAHLRNLGGQPLRAITAPFIRLLGHASFSRTNSSTSFAGLAAVSRDERWYSDFGRGCVVFP
jgi:hypothetical protein